MKETPKALSKELASLLDWRRTTIKKTEYLATPDFQYFDEKKLYEPYPLFHIITGILAPRGLYLKPVSELSIHSDRDPKVGMWVAEWVYTSAKACCARVKDYKTSELAYGVCALKAAILAKTGRSVWVPDIKRD